ncbi:DUF1549 and DUF1553 domain-containing protein [Frigoriglobus tundricola]|uniref:Cytochrome c domain-containing protein n=1 Tax=Frigoriglobus tundricola TaxID=2774151 RepID=A0A6M5Z097_9BACT|nr:DUF1549 and DUF1553 domain-containing protein [Frigoriglobus tundricola]QJW99615.1 hypothetical protein FTUN_7229 [Frigoriglobus tundricola]
MRFLSLVLLLGLSGVVRGAEPPMWWAFEPITRPKVPDRTHPVDHFILARLGDKALSLAPGADRRTLIRRVTFGLTGLPPTPEEVEAFVSDSDANAYEKVVDRLLASPAYGERFARLWMDAVHFAETHGHDQDRVRPNAWRYRDYLIAAFNADTPYSRFVREQIAADVLFPDEPKLVPALGFLAAGPWDESSLRDIREDSIDREIGRYLDRDDIVTTVMNTFAGLTVQCARCHDHKFDPIPQDDYYRLQAVFAGVGRGDVPFEADANARQKRRAALATLAAIARNDPALELNTPELKKAVAAWEVRHSGAGITWTVPEFTRIASGGSTLSRQKDGSVRSEGTRPEKDTYALVARVKGQRVTAVRLELLTDDALPHRGPGRQDNGNLHLSEFTVTAAGKSVKIRSANADFDQAGWTAAHAIDGNTSTAWGIYPQVGQPHEAVFELAEPVGGEGEAELTFALDQLHGGGHLIGRFRISVTDAALPVKASAVPPALRAILATPAAKRSEQQARALALHVLKEQTTEALGALPAPAMVYAAAPNFVTDGTHRPTPTPREVHVLKRGDIRKPGDRAEPGALSLLPKLSGEFGLPKGHTEADRRAALAKWLTDANNPLTRRVMANRVWQWHFGTGLVGTANDFGKMGQQPTHPELLDFLASELANPDPSGGHKPPVSASLKYLHRLIVTSATYKQVSTSRPDGMKADEDNKLLWRQNRTRLDAEQVRDAILAISGRLDRTMGGPSDRQFDLKPGIHVTPVVDYGKFDWDRKEGHRRSVYRFVFRTLPDPLVECLDGADASALTPKRSESVTAPQALALLNNEFVLVHAKAMAARLEKHSTERPKQIEYGCRLVWGRAPTAEEAERFAGYTKKHGLANLCRVLFNTNEFLFED